MKRALRLATVGLVLVAGLAALFVASRPDGPDGDEGRAGDAAPAGERVAAPAGAALDAPAPPPQPAEAEAPAARSAVESAPLAPTTAEAAEDAQAPWLRVRVVGEDGAPREGIEVQVLGVMQDMAIGILRDRDVPRTGPDGVASIPPPRSWGRSLSTPDVTFAVGLDVPGGPRETIDPESLPTAPVELVLPAALEPWWRPLTVRTVDPAGEPVPGVAVRWLWRRPGERGGEQELAQEQSDAAGLAQLPRGRWRERAGQLKVVLGLSSVEHVLRAELPLGEACERVIEDEAALLSGEDLRLELPPLGRLVVEVRAEDGGAPTEAARAASWWRRPGDPEGRYPGRGPWGEVGADGTCDLGPVGLGLAFQVRASAADGSRRPADAEVPGPAQPGEVTRVALVLGEPFPHVAGRVLRPGGEPAREARLRWTVRQEPPPERHPAAGPPRYNWAYLDTDGEGRYRLRFTAPLASEHGRVLEVVEGLPQKDGPRGTLPLPPALAQLAAGDTLELGDLRLVEPVAEVAGTPEVLAELRVVGEDGEPLRWAEASGSWSVPKERGEAPEVTAEKVSPGVFRLVGPRVEEGRFLVSAWCRDHLSQIGRTVEPGGPPLTITLLRAGTVVGRVLVDEGVPFDHLEVRATVGERREETIPYFQGYFEIGQLPAGELTVTVRNRHTDWVLGEVGGLTLGPGERLEDPRLELDLRGRLVKLELTLLTGPDQPLAEQYVWVAGADGRGGSQRTDGQGRLFVWMPADAGECWLRANGYQDVVVQVAAGPQTISLAPR